MEHIFPSESFQWENRTTFSEVPFIPEIFQWNEPKTCVPFTSQPEFPEFLGKWKTPRKRSSPMAATNGNIDVATREFRDSSIEMLLSPD